MDFLPHGYCFAWTPGLLWSMVGSDALIAAAYFSIPVAIVAVVRERRDASLAGVAWLFSGFIFACGITHVMDVWTIWEPYYRAQTLAKIVTALLSVLTAVALWRLIPSIRTIPHVRQLQAAIQSLETEARRRQHAEVSLIDSQQSLAVTLASIGAGFIAVDRDDRITHLNAIAEQLTGWPAAEGLGRPFSEVFERDATAELPRGSNLVDLMIERGITVENSFEVMLRSRHGGRTAIELKGDLTRGSDGELRGAVLVFRDMSRLMRAEAEAKRLASIVESSSDAIIGKDLGGRITSWNAAAEDLFGYTADEVLGRSVLILVPPEHQETESRHLETLANGTRVPTFETVGIGKDGTRRDISVTVSPIHDAQGAIVGASRNARDVSLQRRAEAALRESEAKLRFTMESAQIGEWEVDLRTGRARTSARHAQCFGYAQALPDWSFAVFKQHVHPDDRDGVQRLIARATVGDGNWQFSCRVVWPDGSLHWISAHGNVMRENGVPVRMLGIVTDITPQKLAEEARLNALRLEAENREIQEANRLKSLFLANMSHELRTPLNAIIGFADILYSNAVPSDSPKHREFLGYVATSGRQLLQLINDILDLSKVESGKMEFFPQAVNVSSLVREVKEMFHSAITGKQVNVTEDVGADLDQPVEVDPVRLKQALYNYVSNAIKFTRPGGHITVRARAEGPERFRIEVEDDGIGIAEADVPKLFSEFQQLDAGLNKQHQGTGLGLALTRRLIEAQGGTVGMRSVLGRGSVFFLTLNRNLGTDQPPTGMTHHGTF